MSDRERIELHIERWDCARARHDPGVIVEFVDLGDDEEVEHLLGRYFVPLACAAEEEKPRDRISLMPWLASYVLRLYRPGRSSPVISSCSTYDWED